VHLWPRANFIQNIRASVLGAQVVVVGTNSGPLPSPSPSSSLASTPTPIPATTPPPPPAKNMWTAPWALSMYAGIALCLLLGSCVLICVCIARPMTNYDVGVPQHQVVIESPQSRNMYAQTRIPGSNYNPVFQHWEWQHPPH